MTRRFPPTYRLGKKIKKRKEKEQRKTKKKAERRKIKI